MPRTRHPLTTWSACCVIALCARAAFAHDADVVYARLEAGPAGSLLEIVTLTNATLVQLAPVDADGDGVLTQSDLDTRRDSLRAGVWDDLPLSAGGVACSRAEESATLDDGFVTLTARFSCGPGDLRQDFRILRILPANYRVVLGSQLDGERGRRFAQGVFTALEVPRPGPPGLLDVARLGRGFERGVRDTGVVEALALLLLVWLTAGSSRALGARVAAMALGALVVLSGRAVPVAAAGLMLAGVVALLARGRGRWSGPLGLLAGGLSGAGLALRSALASTPEAVGWWLGELVIGLVLAGFALPLGRILGRRPKVAFVSQLALAAAVLVAVGLRVSAAL
ncbi:MAG: HupE/UreJ family protein [Myxococcaceae bacterium]|nr:HupE/UreJ family protein [Myxococcaceae bacterium]